MLFFIVSFFGLIGISEAANPAGQLVFTHLNGFIDGVLARAFHEALLQAFHVLFIDIGHYDLSDLALDFQILMRLTAYLSALYLIKQLGLRKIIKILFN